MALRFFEDLLDLVDILGHRAFAQRGIIVGFPVLPLPFDVTSRTLGNCFFGYGNSVTINNDFSLTVLLCIVQNLINFFGFDQNVVTKVEAKLSTR